MTETLRPLPILLPEGGLPSGRALRALQEAKGRSGYSGLIRPAVALEGSPEPILAVGCHPSWLTRYAYVPDFTSIPRLTNALTAILMNPEDERMADREDLLSLWFGVEVKQIGEEHVGPRFE